jgi:hypothetical protein
MEAMDTFDQAKRLRLFVTGIDEDLPPGQEITNSRNTVFCVCGSLLDDPTVRAFLQKSTQPSARFLNHSAYRLEQLTL